MIGIASTYGMRNAVRRCQKRRADGKCVRLRTSQSMGIYSDMMKAWRGGGMIEMHSFATRMLRIKE